MFPGCAWGILMYSQDMLGAIAQGKNGRARLYEIAQTWGLDLPFLPADEMVRFITINQDVEIALEAGLAKGN